MQLTHRLWGLLGLCSMTISATTLLSLRTDQLTLDHMVEMGISTHTEILKNSFELSSHIRQNWVFDNTFWDDMVTFVDNNCIDTTWAKENLESSLVTIDADALAILTKDLQYTYQSDTDAFVHSWEFLQKDFLFKPPNLKHFFLSTPDGILEVHTATIHPTIDRPHKTPPHGVLIVLKRWDENALKALSNTINDKLTQIHLIKGSPPLLSSSPDHIMTQALLTDPTGQVIASIQATTQTPRLAELAKQHISYTILILLNLFGITFVTVFAVRQWIIVPIERISQSLSTQDITPLKALLHTNDEFSALSHLIQQNFLKDQQMAQEIAERLLAQEALTRSLKEKEVLLKEIHHRVNNNLQIISSLLTLQISYMPSDHSRTLLKESVHRVRSMALIHQQLYGSDSLASINLANYIQGLVQSLKSALSSNTRVHTDIAPLPIAIEHAVPLGLIINELITNALKYGAPLQPQAETWDISISIKADSTHLHIIVQDRGPGLPEDFQMNTPKTLGLQLINVLTKQLRGRFQASTHNGARMELHTPLHSPIAESPKTATYNR